MYSFHPAWLGYAERAFQNACFIHLVRHPKAAIKSFVRMRFHRLLGRHWLIWDENAWLSGEKCWTSANLHILNFLRQVEPSRKIRVSYEQLVASPVIVTTRICDFLQIPFTQALLFPYSGARAIHDWKGVAIGDPNFLKHSGINSSLGLEWMVVHLPQPLGQATREVARRLNYPTD